MNTMQRGHDDMSAWVQGVPAPRWTGVLALLVLIGLALAFRLLATT